MAISGGYKLSSIGFNKPENSMVNLSLTLYAAAVSLLTLCILSYNVVNGRRPTGRKRGKTVGSTLPHFLNVVEHSWLVEHLDPRGARITKSSHFAQSYRLGYKILLICEAEGDTRPTIKWYKDGLELKLNANMHLYEEKLGAGKIKGKVEVDPATIGDSGTYTCLAGNQFSAMAKHFKVDYYF